MQKFLAAAFAGLALLMAPACATSAGAVSAKEVKIIEPGEIFSLVEWPAEGDDALRAAGWGDKIAEVKSHVGENSAWPPSLKDGETRHFGAETIKTYRTEEVARFQYFKQDVVLLRVPAAKNRHMGKDWQLDTDFFILIGRAGIARS
ncbi:MAG: hypothetical protein IPO30_18615 [Hyphomonadaceae bacterium]|nr:hypothetical protein [Hyphomonadaceae bacterium]